MMAVCTWLILWKWLYWHLHLINILQKEYNGWLCEGWLVISVFYFRTTFLAASLSCLLRANKVKVTNLFKPRFLQKHLFICTLKCSWKWEVVFCSLPQNPISFLSSWAIKKIFIKNIFLMTCFLITDDLKLLIEIELVQEHFLKCWDWSRGGKIKFRVRFMYKMSHMVLLQF